MDHTEEILPAAAAPDAGDRCIQCGMPVQQILQQTPLCPGCREQFVRYPFPVWVKVFGAAVLLLMVVSLFTLPRTLGVGVHYKRGEAAEKKHNYLTAQKELEEVVKKEPSFVNAQCRLLVAAFYNTDLRTLSAALQKLEGKKIEDDALYSEVNRILAKADGYFPSAAFTNFTRHFDSSSGEISLQEYLTYVDSNQSDQYAKITLANRLYELHQYTECDSLLNTAMEGNSGYMPAMYLKMPLKRELGQQDSSVYYADRLLAINHELTYAYASKVKALLKQRKDKEALECGRKGYTIDEKDNYLLGALALAYHFNNEPANRDATLAKISHDSTTGQMMDGIKDVLSGKDKYRE